MESLVLLQGKGVGAALLLVLFVNHAFSQSTYNWVNIDCGSEISYKDGNGIEWDTDKDYIKSGQNKQIKHAGIIVAKQMDNLRFFKGQNKTCYSIASSTKANYLVRAGFFYGNYDGLEKPPTFDLVIDSNKIVMVITSLDKPVFYKMIYAPKRDYIDVCIARRQEDQLPFISSLEVVPLRGYMFGKTMKNRKYASMLNYRVPSGGNNATGLTGSLTGATYDYNSQTSNNLQYLNALWSLLVLALIVGCIWRFCCRTTEPEPTYVTGVVVAQPMPEPEPEPEPVVIAYYVETTTVSMAAAH